MGSRLLVRRPGRAPEQAGGAPSDALLSEALAQTLERAGVGAPVAVSRRGSQLASSFPLEELQVTLRDGGVLRLAFKRLHAAALSPSARLAKPGFLLDPEREPLAYAQLALAAPAGPPRCYGSLPGLAAGERWLFLEWVCGRELYQVGELELWERVARWLGELHVAFAPRIEEQLVVGRLIDHDAAFYRRWVKRARWFAPGHPYARQAGHFLDRLVGRYDAVVEALLELPRTLLHGDFYASNVLVAGSAEEARVAALDWEMAAAGPGLMDLAALLSGGWAQAERDRLTAAYASSAGVAAFERRQLDMARLALAIQWLGWAPSAWAPPRAHRHNWLADAITLAERLEV
jgi:Ser/Thr protein kinase RdoA (MazF antagonist)